MYNIPRYQTGSYIPGLSSQIFGAGLGRDVASEQERLRSRAKSLGKSGIRGRIGSFLGKSGGKWLGKALSAGFAATNPLYALAIQAGGAGLGSYLGSKLGREGLKGEKVGLSSKHGLLGEQYKDLGKYQRGMESAAKGAAWGDAASVFGEGLKSEAGKSIWGGMDADKKTKWFGENLGSKSHEELSKMRLGNMIGKGRLAQGAEDWLGKFGQKEFETDRLKDAAKWAYGGAKDIYGAGKDIYGGISAKKQAWESNLLDRIMQKNSVSPHNYMMGEEYQEGGIVGMQEGGSPADATQTNKMYDLLMQSQIPEYNQYSMQDQDRIDDENEELMNLVIGSIGGGGKGVSKESFMKISNIIKRLKDKPIKGKLKPPGYYSKRNLDMQHYHDSPIPSTPPKSPYHTDLTINPFSGKYFDRNFADESGEIWDLVDALKKSGMQEGGMAYPLQMAGGGYLPEQGFGGLIQHRKGY